MTKKAKCGVCEQRRRQNENKTVELLIKGINADMAFEDAVAYAGLNVNDLTAAYNLLVQYLSADEMNQISNKIEWS